MDKASTQALAAVRAVKNLKRWGNYATARFLVKRGAYSFFIRAMLFEGRRQS